MKFVNYLSLKEAFQVFSSARFEVITKRRQFLASNSAFAAESI